MLFFNFIFYLLTDNSFVLYRLRDFWYEVQKKSQKNIQKKESFQAGRTWWFGRMSDYRMSRRLYGRNIYIEHAMSKHFVGQSQSGVENPNKHVHDFVTTHTSDSIPFFLHSKRMVRFLFYYIHFFICCFL